eukprot:TRINITY_DN383_c0_g1_i1.p1 TRINITY_DN383_c0_g1~~TRINITY_DN383_c0_g1_i1.p1  ORF type:complete len:244 (-),score=51.88 TRINITY_DN383_c0_g1_i1:279-974(-)
MAASITRVPFKFTYVTYVEDDLLSLYFAFSSLYPVLIVTSFFSLCLFTRELQTCYFFLGQLLNEALALTLKELIKQPRPHTDLLLKDYGMPSSHAQFMSFFTSYVFFSFFFSQRVTFQNPFGKYLILAVLLFLTGSTAYSRLEMKYHSLEQVVAGHLIGILTAFVWFLTGKAIITPYVFPFFENTRLFKFFYLRDSSSIPNLLKFQYDAAIEYKQNSGKKGAALSLGKKSK